MAELRGVSIRHHAAHLSAPIQTYTGHEARNQREPDPARPEGPWALEHRYGDTATESVQERFQEVREESP